MGGMKEEWIMTEAAALLLAWYDAHARSLPWRGIHDPYRTWVSETMLQQTRVETVLAYYDRFLQRFPTVEALAAAPEDDVPKAAEDTDETDDLLDDVSGEDSFDDLPLD